MLPFCCPVIWANCTLPVSGEVNRSESKFRCGVVTFGAQGRSLLPYRMLVSTVWDTRMHGAVSACCPHRAYLFLRLVRTPTQRQQTDNQADAQGSTDIHAHPTQTRQLNATKLSPQDNKRKTYHLHDWSSSMAGIINRAKPIKHTKNPVACNQGFKIGPSPDRKNNQPPNAISPTPQRQSKAFVPGLSLIGLRKVFFNLHLFQHVKDPIRNLCCF